MFQDMPTDLDLHVTLLGKELRPVVSAKHKLQNVQNFAARIITRSQKFDHITPVPKGLKWLSVESMHIYRDCIVVLKCLRGLALDYLAKKLKKSEIHNN